MAEGQSITRGRGFTAAGGTCGVKPAGKPDLMLRLLADRASGFLSALPAVLLGAIFQCHMVQGLTTGSVKG